MKGGGADGGCANGGGGWKGNCGACVGGCHCGVELTGGVGIGCGVAGTAS